MPSKSYFNTEGEITLDLLKAVDCNEELTQRSLANELGIALGLANTYLKRCVKKGFIKILQVPSNRYAYYLTPSGFAEKTRLTAEYLSQSLSLFRQAQIGYTALLDICAQKGWTRLCLCGVSDLAEITILYARDYNFKIISIVDADYAEPKFRDCPIVEDFSAASEPDVFIVTSLRNTQEIYNLLIQSIDAEKVLIPDFLEVQRSRESISEDIT